MKKRLILYFLIILLSLLAYFSNISSRKYFSFIFEGFYWVLMPVVELKGRITDAIKNITERYIYLVKVEERNRELTKEIQSLYLYKAQLKSCESSLREVEELLGIKRESYGHSVLFARIVGYDPSGRDGFILIDKGKDHGIDEGFIVFSKDKFIGFVDKAFSSTSRVRTVYSEDLTVSSTTENTGKSYIYKGGWRYGKLLYVNVDDEVKRGDLVLLRDNKGTIPSFLIGSVYSVEQGSEEFFKKVLVLPSVDIRRLEYVAIIKGKL